ncbi:MAG: penicillin-binding protein 2 [Desulfobacterales bacterium]|nr:penicillin-binding protein 2 [Desulfobacterales bacterium]
MNRYVKSVDHDWYKQRVVAMMICVLVGFVALVVRLVYLQVVMGQDFYRLSMNNSIRLQAVDPPRGLILDRNGTKLAENRPSFDVSFTPKDAGDVQRVLAELSTHLKVAPEDLQQKLRHSRGLAAYRPVLLRQDIGRDTLAGVEARKIDMPGVSVQVRLRRNYLYGLNASHVIGYLGEVSLDELKGGDFPGLKSGDFIGKFGIERTYERFLRGTPGGRQVEVNANGQIMRVLRTVSPKPGHNVHLTLDLELQQLAERLLEGVAGAAVAVDPTSGFILALASSPTFNQNAFASGIASTTWEGLITNPYRPMENKAIQGEYPPGSTYKIVTALAGLEEKVIDESTSFDCTGALHFAGRDYRCWKKEGHGRVDVRRALAESCDVFFYRVGQRLGVDRLAWYSSTWKKKRFGVPWQDGETLSISIGQGFVLATPLQMAMFVASVGNGGIRYRPAILSRVESMEGDVVFQTVPQELGRLPVSSRNLKIAQQGIWAAVNGDRGTARRVHLNDIEVSGKTGTSQVVGRKEVGDNYVPPHLLPHAWFVCYAPAAAPRIAVAVVVENGEHGSSAAGPISRELVKAYLRRLPGGQNVASEDIRVVPAGNG